MKYNSYLNKYNGYTSQFDDNIYYGSGHADAETADLFANAYKTKYSTEFDGNRSLLDRGLDLLMLPNYAIAGFAKGIADNGNVGDVSPWQGAWEGIKAGNPFGKGYAKGEHTFSEVLGESGWNPTSTLGKIAKGTIGFGLDVLLDPTTYLTGGASALVKGTGKTAIAATHLAPYLEKLSKIHGIQIGDDVSKVAGQVSESLINKGVAPELAARYADKVADKVSMFSGGMTQDIAKRIITSRTPKIAGEELEQQADRLTKKYNELIGLRDPKQGISLSLGNAPFGKKIFGKLAEPSLNIPGTAIRELSDKVGIAQKYGQLRNTVYGSKLGKLFSTTAPLYELSKTKPEQFFNYLQFVDTVKGLKGDKLLAERMVRDKAKTMGINMTPADMNNLLNIMQDKTVWATVQKAVKFAQTEEAKQYRDAIEVKKQKAQNELADLLDTKNNIDDLIHATDAKIYDTTEGLTKYRDEYRQKLLNLRDVEHLDASDKAKVIKSLMDEAEHLNKKIIENSFNKFKNSAVDSQKNVALSMHDEWKKATEAQKKHMSQIGELKKQFIKPHKDMTPLERKHAQLNNEMIGNKIKEVQEFAPTSARNKQNLIEKLGEYIYGDKTAFGKNMYDGNVDELADMVKKGMSREEIQYHVERNPHAFTGRAAEINSHIAQIMGYGSGTKFPTWDAYYTDRLKQLNDLLKKNKGFTREQENLFVKLQQDNMKRKMLLNEFSKAGSLEDVKRIMQKHLEDRMFKEYADVEHLANTTGHYVKDVDEVRRSKINDDLRSTSTRNIQKKTGETYGDGVARTHSAEVDSWDRSYSEFKDSTAYNSKMIGKDKVAFKEDIASQVFRNKKLSDFHWVNLITDQAQQLLDNVFKKPIEELTEGQYDLLKKLSIQNAQLVKAGKDPIKALGSQASKIEKELAQRAELERIDAIQKKIQPHSRVDWKEGEGFGSGTIHKVITGKDGAVTYDVLKADGELVKKNAADFTHVGSDYGKMDVEQLIKQSPTTEDYVTQRNAVRAQIEELKKGMSDAQTKFAEQRKSYVDEYLKRTEKLKETLGTYQSKADELRRMFVDGHDEAVDKLSKQINKMSDVLSSDEAFENYMMTEAVNGRKIVYDAIQKAGKTTQLVLDTDMSIPDKVKELAKVLRADFIEMGKKEVGIGKLTEEQFNNMMWNYLPHVLTTEGERFLSKYAIDVVDDELVAVPKEITKKGVSVTQDLGYGLKFNPYSKTRTIKTIKLNGEWVHNPTIQQINEALSPLLKGKNLFSENIADIYMARANKHLELMYDHEYMENMMEVFGHDVPQHGVPKEGFKAVMNIGKFRQNINNMASFNLSLQMTSDLTDFVRNITSRGYIHPDELQQQIKVFLAENYGKDKILEQFNKHRNNMLSTTGVKELSMAEMAKPMVELNPEQIKSIREYYAQTRYAYQSLLSKRQSQLAVLQQYGVVGERVDKMIERIDKMSKKLDNLREPQIKQVNDVIVQKANQARQLQMLKSHSRFLQIYDTFTRWFKLNQTTIMPSFHARNKMANMFLNWLAVGKDAVDVRLQRDAYNAIKHKGDSELVRGAIAIKRPDGTVEAMNWDDVYHLAKQHDVVDEGFFAKDLGTEADSKGLFKSIPAKYDPTDTANFIGYRKGTEIGNKIENTDRLVHFVSMLKQGHTAEEAAESVKKFLFDYSDLTQFEKHVMKRIFPYYTWLRKNARLQLSQMLEQPGKYQMVAKVEHGIEGFTDKKDQINKGLVNDFAKDWVQLPFSITNREGRTEPILLNPNLPFQDISRIPNPLDFFGSFANLFTQSNPLIKIPAEETMNKNVFLDKDIVEKDGSQVLSRADHLLSQLSTYGAAKDLVQKDGLDFGLSLLNTFGGVKALSYDYDKFKFEVLDRLKSKQGNVFEEYFDSIVGGFKGLGTRINGGAQGYNYTYMPVSPQSYNNMPSSEQQLYRPPTFNDAIVYNLKGAQLEQQTGKRLTWALVEPIKVSASSKPFTVGHVTHVRDGDTFDVMVDGKNQGVRLLLVDTPETVDPRKSKPMPFGHEASEYTKKSLFDKDVKMYFDSSSATTDKYGRMLVYVEVDGRDYNKELLSKGLAKYRYADPKVKYERQDDYIQTEMDSYNKKEGIWSIPGYSVPGLDIGYNPDK